jgi:nitrous oxidase accessory protein NosD
MRECRFARVTGCLVRNYMRVTIDDRTKSLDWGYAFNCTDGTGIQVTASQGTLIEGNTVIEEIFRPTKALKKEHQLGVWTKKNPIKGKLLSQETWDSGYTDNWQQGSGIVVTAPEASDLTRILGNHIENAAQGIDLHADRVIVAHNVITNSFMGMKAMHGSRNVLITGNQFVKNSLWAIGLMPGAAAHPGQPDKPETANADGGSVISANIISDFGHGDARWIWGDDRSPFKFDTGQQPDDPPLADVIVQGNLLHCIGAPRYRYAVVIAGPIDGPKTPRGMRFHGNTLAPGKDGVANRKLPE